MKTRCPNCRRLVDGEWMICFPDGEHLCFRCVLELGSRMIDLGAPPNQAREVVLVACAQTIGETN